MPNTIAVMRKMRSAMSAIAPHSVAGRRPDHRPEVASRDRTAAAALELGGIRARAGNISMVSKPSAATKPEGFGIQASLTER
jgi:hypothetical protein